MDPSVQTPWSTGSWGCPESSQTFGSCRQSTWGVAMMRCLQRAEKIAFGVIDFWVVFLNFVADRQVGVYILWLCGIFMSKSLYMHIYTIHIQICMNIYNSSLFICGLQTYVQKSQVQASQVVAPQELIPFRFHEKITPGKINMELPKINRLIFKHEDGT